MIECDWCDGTGLTPGTENQCPNCEGKGMITADHDDLNGEPTLYRPRRKTHATQQGPAVIGARVITQVK
jgi:DnaJ-class molecular chaperone